MLLGAGLALGLVTTASLAHAQDRAAYLARLREGYDNHASGAIYHGSNHLHTISRIARELRLSSTAQRAARLHDYDPREPGTPPSVERTVRVLNADQDLQRDAHVATPVARLAVVAMIRRTDYPVDLAKYRASLHELRAAMRAHPEQIRSVLPRVGPGDTETMVRDAMRIVVTESAQLAFADQIGNYAINRYREGVGGTEALAGEINRAGALAGRPAVPRMTLLSLHPGRFLDTIANEDFADDHAIAREMGLGDLPLPSARGLIARLHPATRRNLAANRLGLRVTMPMLRAHVPTLVAVGAGAGVAAGARRIAAGTARARAAAVRARATMGRLRASAMQNRLRATTLAARRPHDPSQRH